MVAVWQQTVATWTEALAFGIAIGLPKARQLAPLHNFAAVEAAIRLTTPTARQPAQQELRQCYEDNQATANI